MAKKRGGQSRAEFLAERERKYQEAVRATGAKTIYHMMHSCGHQAYWDEVEYAYLSAEYPCLWCGGQAGVKPPPESQHIVHNSDGLGPKHIRRNPNVRCQCEAANPSIIVKHKADESCCQGPHSMN